MSLNRIKVWDLPTRLFHWLLVILVAAAIITGEVGGGAIDWHGRIGLALVGLIVFRIIWGVVGSSTARFASFFPSPASLRAYLKGEWHGVGHNPLGAFSVFGLLALISLQLATGLFSNDDIAFNGPLSSLIAKSLSDSLSGVHEFTVGILISLIVLHLAAIAFYTHVKKDNLITPMLTGWKEVEKGQAQSTTGGSLIALAVALSIAAAAVYGASGAWIAQPPPAETPPAAAW
ncbi:MAG: cytochrome b/b6 domain-containing protein [Betaproteobacteria bacterium]